MPPPRPRKHTKVHHAQEKSTSIQIHGSQTISGSLPKACFCERHSRSLSHAKHGLACDSRMKQTERGGEGAGRGVLGGSSALWKPSLAPLAKTKKDAGLGAGGGRTGRSVERGRTGKTRALTKEALQQPLCPRPRRPPPPHPGFTPPCGQETRGVAEKVNHDYGRPIMRLLAPRPRRHAETSGKGFPSKNTLMKENLDVWSSSSRFVTMRGPAPAPSSRDKAVRAERWKEPLAAGTQLTWPWAQTSCYARF